MSTKVSISASYDSGNIEFVKAEEINGRLTAFVRIKPDVFTELEEMAHMQFFSFRSAVEVTGDKPVKVDYVIENASEVSYPSAWTGTTVFFSDHFSSPEAWRRNLTTQYIDGKLRWTQVHTSKGRSVYFNYFPPYTYESHLGLVHSIESAPHSSKRVFSLGKTLKGREIDCCKIGTGKTICWIIHRQHPGETMAEHYAEGLLKRLIGLDNEESTDEQKVTAEKALELYTFYIVPCMCIDGGVLGHLRTNSVGANLNREWATKGEYVAPSLERSPEVYHTLHKMDETGVDVFLDIHGDEELPFNFISGAEQTPAWNKSPRLKALHGALVASYHRANSDMQADIGYPPPESAEGALKYMNVATNQVANRFDCLAVTLEMPFKDCESNPDPDEGWSCARSRALGASSLDALLYVHPYLRDESDFWNRLPVEDAYVVPHDDYQGFKPLTKRLYSDVRAIQNSLGVESKLDSIEGLQ